MSTDAICTCSHGLGVLRHADDCPVAIERRQPVRLAALSAPSESAAKANEFGAAVAADAAHQRGFDHGRRWAAEEVLRIAAEEIRLQSSWLWHALGEERLTEVAARFGRRLIRDLEHPAAPSEPVPDGPRVWASPTIPTDVKAVLDGEGDQWKRNAKGRWNVQTPPNVPANTTGGYTDNELIDFYGPLTEVVEESTP